MAQCPKCGGKLRLYHWRPECPFCGVNMVYYESNDRILAETEQAEIEHAKSQPGIDRAKAAFFGSPPAIARIVLSALPLGALFLPLGRLPQTTASAINAIGLYQHLSDAGIGSPHAGNMLDLAQLLLLVSAVLVLACLICLPFSLGKHGKQRNLILNSLLLGCAAASAALFAAAGGRLMAGAFVYLALLAAILVYNLILAKKGLKIKYTVCYIGGLPSAEYFSMKEQGVPEIEIRKKMVAALTAMQDAVRQKAAQEEMDELAKRAAHK